MCFFRWDLLPAVFFVFLSGSPLSFWRSLVCSLVCFPCLVLASYSGCFERFSRFLFEKSCFSFRDRYFWRCMKSLFALIAVGLDAVRIAFSKSKIGFDSKSIVQIAGIGTLYGILFAGLLLMPLPRPPEMQAATDTDFPCSFTQFLVTPGYGSSLEPTGGFSGYICYEQYDDFIKCLRKVDNAYRVALQNAEDDRRGCNWKCALGTLGAGLGCVIFSIITIGTGGTPCAIAVAGGSVGCLAYCRIDLSTARKKAANNADGAIQACIIDHSPTDNQRGSGTIPNHGNILLEDRLWRAN